MKPRRVVIIGGGISGLATGFLLQRRLGEQDELIILEKSNRLGGTIGITHRDGYTADWGPNGFLDKEPLTLDLIEQVGLSHRLVRAHEKAEKRYIYKQQKLWEISPHPLKFLTSGLLSLPGRLRVPLEYFVRATQSQEDESIYAFACRRIGKQAADYLITPMVMGIFGGDAKKLSLAACFPIMAEMEREYGGLIKAMIKKKKNKKNNKTPTTAGPSGRLTSFRGGCYALIEALEKHLQPHLRMGVSVEIISRDSDHTYVLETPKGPVTCDGVVLAVPSFAAAEMLAELQPGLAKLLEEIEYTSLAVVCQGFPTKDIAHPVDGFGFLVPPDQNSRILGSIWTSAIFPDQAPPDEVLFRTMMGGPHQPDLVGLSKNHLAEIASEELAAVLGIAGKPRFEQVIVWKNAIPQYTLGHRERLQQIENNLLSLPNFFLAGNAYKGVGINDVIKLAYQIAENYGGAVAAKDH